MPIIKVLDNKDIELFKEQLIQYIYESNKNSAYMESYGFKDAEAKYGELIEYVCDNKAIIYGAIEQNRLIGFIWAYQYPFRDDQSRIYVSILHVNEEYRGRSIGKKLLCEIENYAKKRKMHAVYLHAETFNTGAVRFYKRNGYEIERIQMLKKMLEESQPTKIDRSEDAWGGGYAN